MQVTNINTNAMVYMAMYRGLLDGNELKPRGQLIREVEDAIVDIDMNHPICTSFIARNMSLKYACNEFLWYLRGDIYDRSIEDHASMWPKLIQPEGFYYSNYGAYMFDKDSGFDWVCNSLSNDIDSRQAAIPFLNSAHCFKGNKDMVCTYSLSFRIRNEKLNMSVNMRSNDAVFGFTNDSFCFAMFYEMVYARLCSAYPFLQRGTYCHKVDSLHIYERHFKMVERIVEEGVAAYVPIHIPPIATQGEAMTLRHTSVLFNAAISKRDFIDGVDPTWRFTKWLLEHSM